MSAFDDIKEQVTGNLKNIWERIQESSIAIQLKERYENLTPAMQKVTLITGCIVFSYLIISIPMSLYTTSQDYVDQFEGKRDLIRDLLKVSRDSKETPDIPAPPEAPALRAQIQSILDSNRFLPEQIVTIENTISQSHLIPGDLALGAMNISLSQLNIRQVIDVGHQLQSISPSIKLTDLEINQNKKDPRFFDVFFRLTSLAVPKIEMAFPEPELPSEKKNKKGDEE